MEAGRSPYRRRAIEMTPWIKSVVEQFQQDAASRGHQVHLNMTAHSANVIDGDEDALSNALWNLLDNAVKYSPEAADVWIDMRLSEESVAIAVRDAGIGIAPQEQRAIFGKFVRGARAKADRIAGTGLGLAIVDHVVQAHGGTTTVRSALDQGSTFTITLPVFIVLPTTGAEPREIFKAPAGQSARVLAWTPANDALLVRTYMASPTPTAPGEIWWVPVASGQPERLAFNAGENVTAIDISPDGRRLAYTTRQPETPQELWVLENFLEPAATKR
jgi:anti-sigma regulatory factor (Ser/Thr protein kinase)